jgi:hypothetical protein
MENVYSSYSLSLGNSYILAAEDSLVQAKKLQFFFDKNKIHAKIFSNAIDAYAQAETDPPILIISDIVMPGMDGYEFCSKIKNHKDLRDIPVILLTSLSDPLDIIKGLQAGADNFITKPYDEQYLLTRIHFLLANHDMRRSDGGDMSIDIAFQGQKYKINSDKKQILNLLLSVYEAAINRNNELIDAKQLLETVNMRLQSANEELDAFTRTVSHDLKSPLSGIIGFAELLSDTEGIKLNEEASSHLDWILKSAYKMNVLINDLLNYSRSNRAEIEPVTIDVSQMAREISNELIVRYNRTNTSVLIVDGLSVIADRSLFHIILDNLIGNAVKYSSKKDKPEILIGSKVIDGRPTFYVKDNGAGFDMSKSDKIFDPFIRLHKDEDFQGTGVGLSTVKRIIDRHNGTIWAKSEPENGAVFYFTIGNIAR